jgi:hypothetical protein
MSISFACPECKAQIEVADEHAGQSGQCPRCERVIVIPSPKQPQPVLAGANVPSPSEPWRPREAGGSKPRPVDADEPVRPRRARTMAPPAGPTWPWVVGVFAAVVAAVLLFASFIVLVSWRKPDPRRRKMDIVVFKEQPTDRVAVGVLDDRRRVFLEKGIFKLDSELNQRDQIDFGAPRNSPCKIYQIELLANQNYVFELETGHFDSEIRLEQAGQLLQAGTGKGGAMARFEFQPRFTQVHNVIVTTTNRNLGHFTLTIQERQPMQKFP